MLTIQTFNINWFHESCALPATHFTLQTFVSLITEVIGQFTQGHVLIAHKNRILNKTSFSILGNTCKSDSERKLMAMPVCESPMCIHMQKDPIHILNCPYLQGLILTLFPTHPVPATLSGVNLTIEECTHVCM